MNRTIKFRAWDERERRFYTSTQPRVDFVFGKMGDGVYIENVLRLELSDGNAQQYTGLKDMNEVEIYEGDILAYRDGEYSFNARVTWGDHGWFMDGYYLEGGSDVFNFDDNDSTQLEIVGNIYEKPELLK